MPRSMHSLTSQEKREIIRTFRGQVPGVPNPSTAGVARRFDITESDASILREAITTPAPKQATPTRTLAEALRERHAYESAETMMNRANAAEEKGLAKASLQELAAVATLSVPIR